MMFKDTKTGYTYFGEEAQIRNKIDEAEKELYQFLKAEYENSRTAMLNPTAIGF